MTTTAIQPAAENGALSIIREAIDSKVSPEHLRELLAVRQTWEADEARKAYNIAVADFQRRCPIIEKADKGYSADYARIDRIWRTIRPLLGELGLSVTWQIAELRNGLCHVEGQLRHRDGHGERLVYDCPLPALVKNSSGRDVQNVAQQFGSASSYAKRYATCGALGVVTGEDDDDGHAAGTQYVTHDQAQEIAQLVDACRGIADFNEKAFRKWIGVENPQDVPANRFNDVRDALNRKLKGK